MLPESYGSLQSLFSEAIPTYGVKADLVLGCLIEAGKARVLAGDVAAAVGMRDRYAVRKILQAAGLPSFRIVSGWCRLIAIAFETELTGLSPTALALRDGLNQDAYTGLSRRVTGGAGALNAGSEALLILMSAALGGGHRAPDVGTTAGVA